MKKNSYLLRTICDGPIVSYVSPLSMKYVVLLRIVSSACQLDVCSDTDSKP